MRLIDSHCHLQFPDLAQDLKDVVDRAKEQGVEDMVVIGTDPNTSRDAVALAATFPGLWAAVGVHPHDVEGFDDSTVEELRHLARQPRVVAIGEIGLDFYRRLSPAQDQLRAFKAQCRLACELRLPLIVHNRNADEEVLNTLFQFQTDLAGGVLHCFSGNLELARAVMQFGFKISVAGNITYPNAAALRDAVSAIPVEEMLLETDSPFLPPQSKRGKRNEPAFIVEITETIAGLKGLSTEDVARITTVSAESLFFPERPAERGKIAYTIRNSLYLNITNRCTNKCVFCARQKSFYVKGHNLQLETEPSTEEVLASLPQDLSSYKEVVFCGLGEPTLRLDVLKQVARYLKSKNMRVRLNTNGHGNLVHGRNIFPELAGLIDAVDVSLNSAESSEYHRLCAPTFGPDTFRAVREFVALAREYIPEVEVTAVNVPGIDVQKCKRLAQDELGAGFRLRQFNEVG